MRSFTPAVGQISFFNPSLERLRYAKKFILLIFFGLISWVVAAQSVTPSVTSLPAFSSTYGYISSEQSFTFDAAGQTPNTGQVTITAPTGFEVSLTTATGFAASVLSPTADGSGNLTGVSIFVRLKASASNTAGNYSGNITLTPSTAAANVSITSSTISPKALTMTGLSLTASSKVYNASTSASVTGSPALSGTLETFGAGTAGDGQPFSGDVINFVGSATGTYNSKDVLSATTVSFGGLTLSNSNYSLTIQSPVSGTITTAPLTVSGVAANNKPYDGGPAATLTLTSPTLVGIVASEDVTLTGSPVGTFANNGPGTGITVNVTGYSLGGTATLSNYQLIAPTPPANIISQTTVTQITGGVTSSSTINTSTGTVAVLGFSLNNVSATGNLTGLTLTTTADPSTLFSSIKLLVSADNTYGGDTQVSATLNTTSTTIAFSSITGQSVTMSSTFYYFLEVTLKPFFPTANPTIGISFDPTTSAITFSNSIVGTGALPINTINGATTSYTLHDDIAPTIVGISNTLGTIYQGALTQTVAVQFSEPMTNSGFDPVISFSAGTWPSQATGGWSQTTYTNDTYTTTFAHSAATEERQTNVTSSVSTTTAKDVSLNVVSNTFTSAGNFLLDNQRPTVTITQVAVSTGSFSRTTDNSVAYNIVFSEPLASGTFDAGDITLTSGGTSSSGNALTNPSSDNKTFLYTINNITGDGTLTITLGTGYTDVVGNAPAASVGPSAGFTIDNTAPKATITLVDPNPATGSTASTLHFTVTFTEPVNGVDIGDFALTTSSSNDATGSIAFTSAITLPVTTLGITVSSIVADYGSGTPANLSLDMTGATGIVDLATNPFGFSVTNAAYLVDDTPPTVVNNDFAYSTAGTGQVVFSISEPLQGTSINGFTIGGVVAGGTTNPTGTFDPVTNTITLTNAGAAGTWPATITVSYAIPGSNKALDLAGNLMAAISATAVDVPNVNLQPGDIAFTVYDSKPTDGSHPDGFSFVILKDLPAQTKIFFTDNGWTGSVLQTGETTVTWTSPNSVTPAGTEVSYSSGTTCSIGTAAPSKTFDLHSTSSKGDQVLAYQGTSGNPVLFIAAINCSNTGTIGANGWNSSIDATNPTNESELPTGLTAGTNAISFASAVKDNVQYNKTVTTGSAQQLRAAMMTTGNFNTTNGDATHYYALTSSASNAVYKISPVITAVTITDNKNYIVGSYPGAVTITVQDDRGSAHTLNGAAIPVSNIDGFSISNLVRGTTTCTTTCTTSYTADFTVAEGGTDIPVGTDIPISVDLLSSQNNPTVAVSGVNIVQKFTTAIAHSNRVIDAHSPTITSITNSPSTAIKVGSLILTVTVAYSESTSMNTSIQPPISLSGGSAHWGLQMPSGGTNGWTGNTYKATFAHDGTPEGPISVQSSVAVGGAKDVAGNPNVGSITSTAFTLDTKLPTLAAANITFNKSSVNVSNIGTGSNTIRVKVQYSEQMKNTVTPTITFSNGTFGTGVPVGTNGWSMTSITDDTYQADFTDNTTTDEFTGVTATVSNGQDNVGNVQSGSTVSTATFLLDTKAPTVSSSNIVTATPTNANSVQFLVTFSESVSAIDVTDFSLATSGTVAGTIASVSVTSGSSVTVTVNSITGDGTLGLNVKTLAGGATLQDGGTNPLIGGFTGGQTYTIDHTPPVVASIAISSTLKGIGATNGIVATSVTFLVTFTEINLPLSGIGAGGADFSVGTDGSVAWTTKAVTGSGNTRTVTISGITGTGRISLGVTDDDTILDAAGNPLDGAADGSVSPSFTGTQYYTIVLPEPGAQAFDTPLQTTSVTSNSVTLKWGVKNTSTPLPTSYLIMAKPSSVVSFPATVNDAVFVNTGTLIQNVTRTGITDSYTFSGLNSGTNYDFIVYKYAWPTNTTNDNIDFELTTATVPNGGALNGVLTITGKTSWALFNSAPTSISSILDNTTGNKASVMTFTIYDDGIDPISPNVMTLHLNDLSQETITFTLRDQLSLAEGAAVTGFTSSTGSISSAIYSGKGTTNTITLTNAANGTWTVATPPTISYSATTGNAQFSTLPGSMQSIASHVVAAASETISTITTNGTFTVPAGVTSIQVEAWGAGGAGGMYSQSAPYNNGSGYGGGGGAYSRSLLKVNPGDIFTVVIGNGGPAVQSTTDCCDYGVNGGVTSFGGLVVAEGGYGALSSAIPVADGYGFICCSYSSGGLASNGQGDITNSGGSGGFGSNIFPNPGGGGGSSGGTAANGISGSNANPSPSICLGCTAPGGANPGGGGAGGAGAQGGGGGTGVFPGGGGGGVGGPYPSGAGADGQVIVTYSLPVGGGTSDWAGDNSPFKFSQLVIKQGTGNSPTLNDWRNIIAGAELYDGANTTSGTVNPANGTDITFSSIPSSNPTTDVGNIADANGALSSKTYTLKIWLKNNLSNTLAASVDGLSLAFMLDLTNAANLTYDDATNNAQESSRLVSATAAPAPILNSGAEQIQVVATQLDFSTNPNPAQLALTNITASSTSPDNVTYPVVRARDKNGNTDTGFSSSTIGLACAVGALPTPISMASGVASLSGVQYQDAGDGTLTASTTGLTSGISTPTTTVSYSNTTIITTANIAPLKVLSTATTGAGTAVLDFKVFDDNGVVVGTDGAATLISQIVITKGAGNTVTNWNDAIAGASITIYDQFTNTTSAQIPATSFGTNSITFGNLLSGTPVSTDNGYVKDNYYKTYTLYIVLKSPMATTTEQLDDKQFVFVVDQTLGSPSITLNSKSSLFAPTQMVTSGATKDVIDVEATKLVFVQDFQTSLLGTTDISTQQALPVINAVDVRGNLDIDYNSTSIAIGIIPTSLTTANAPATNSLNGGVLTFAPNFQFTQTGTSRQLTVSSTNLNAANGTVSSATSAVFTVHAGVASIIKNPSTSAVNISSLTTSASGSTVFTFTVQDDPPGTPPAQNDGEDTRISKMIFVPSSSNNTISDWSQAIAGARLEDASNSAIFLDLTPSTDIGVSTLTFNGISFGANGSGLLGNVPDNMTKTYNLKIWLKNNLSGTQNYNLTIDGLKFGFNVTDANITADPTGTSFLTSQTANSTNVFTTVAVIATQLDFTTPAAATPVSINTIVSPVIKARDINANVDLDFTGGSGIVTAFSNNASPTTVTMSNGPLVGTTQFASGVLDFSVALPGFKFTTGDNNETFTVSITGTGGISGTSPTLTLKTNTITPGVLVEPPTISSLADDFPHTAGGTKVFDFKINDDDNLISGTDVLPTLISQIKITQLAGNQIVDWQDLIASATLTDDATPTPNTISGTVNPTDITFAGITNAVGALGYIGDNVSKTYTLNIVLRSSLGGSLSPTVDNLHLAFEVLAPNISIVSPGVGSSTFSTSENENSGATNNAIQVIATRLVFSTSPGVDLLVNKDISLQLPVPVVEAWDANVNRDLDYNSTTVTVTNAGGLPMINVPGNTSIVQGIATFANTFQYDAIGDGTLTIASTGPSVVTNAVSAPTTNVRVGIAGTITPGALAEPATISSLVDLMHTPAGEKVFDFTINDDPSGTPATEDDVVPTRISSITITQGSGNTITNWDEVFAHVQLDDGASPTPVSGTINSNSLVFNLSNTVAADQGYITDNLSKTYTLTVWLKTNLSGTQNYPITIDGMKFVFEVLQANVATNVNGSAIKPGENQNSGANNTVTVVATQLDITTPSTAVDASISTDFPGGGGQVAVQARDVNANRDLDFIGKITSVTNATNATMTGTSGNVIGTAGSSIQFGTTPFASGLFMFPSVFQFTTGNNTDIVTLTIKADNIGGTTGVTCATDAICSGISPTITLLTSFESSLVGDPTFPLFANPTPPAIDYVNYQEAVNIQNTGTSYELIRALLVDGSRSSTYVYNNGTTTATLHTQTDSGDGDPDGDTDGATTNLTSISLKIKRAVDIRRIALYSNGVEIPGTEIDLTAIGGITALNPDSTLTWSKSNGRATNLILLTAPDDGQVPLSVRVSFRNTSPELNDADNILIDLTAATITTGSQFYRGDGPDAANNPGPYIAGQTHSGGPNIVGIIDVVATSLDFTTQPSSFAGVTEPIGIDPNTSQPYAYGNPATLTLMPTTSPGTVMARDRFGLVDTGFAPPSISMTDAGNNTLLIPASFVNGVLSLNGMHYTSKGNGTLTIIADRNAAGTIATSTGSAIVTGVGTNFDGELNVGSVIKDPSGNPIGTVLSIASSTSLTLAANASIALTSSAYLAAVNSANSSSSNSKPCALVTVLDVTVTYDNSGLVPPTIASPPGASLKGGNTGYNIFGLKFTANNTSGSEPNLKGFTINFDVPFDSPGATIFKNLIIREVNSTGTFDITSSTIGGTLTKGGSQAGAQIYDQIIVDLSAKPQSLGTGSISFFLTVDVDAKVNLATPSITPSFSDRGYGFPDDQNSIVSNGTSTGTFTGTKYSFASTQPPILLTTSTDLTSPYAGQPNVDPYLQKITLQFNTNVGSFDRGGAGNAELWLQKTSGTIKVADLIYSSDSLARVNLNNTVSNTYPTISYDIVDPTTHLPLTQPLNADSVYFVTLIKGNYDAVAKKGQGITDFGLNFYGGISSNSTLYFKISSSNAPKLSNAKSAFNTTSIGTVTTTFDQFGTAFFLIVKQGDPAPTKAEMLDIGFPAGLPAAYNSANPSATVGASGSYKITSINTDQTQVFTSTSFLSGQAYDVYIIAENDAVSHGAPSPVVAAGVYGSSPYAAGTPGPTTTIPVGSNAGSIGYLPIGANPVTPNLSNSNFLICPDSYSTISSPIIVAEAPSGSPVISFAALYQQDFNILLPTGYQFDVTVAPNVQLFGGDFSPLPDGHMFDYKYTSNTVLNINFLNSTSTNPDDYIVITGLSIIGKSGSAQGNINWFYGNNVFTNNLSYNAQTFLLGTIALQAVTPLDFYNSYWKDNQLLFNALQPPGTVIGDALNKTVNAIPDNFADVTFPGQLQLIPDNRTLANKSDYLASFFSGNGVSGDLFTLNSVATGAAFNITITHTDLNGCVTQKPEQYLVYDHRNPISNKLGLAYPAGSPLAGTEQAIVNTNWPAAANAISSPILGAKELAGYTLQQLTVDLPSSEISANQASTPSANQWISGASWRTRIRNSILSSSAPSAPLSYTWDYSSILNTSSSIVNSTPYKTALGLNDVYDYFKSTNATPKLNSNYWLGGFLGNIEFTGIYQSTADNSVYSPFRQNIGLYVPAVPALEVTSVISKADLSDVTTGVNGVTVQSLGTTTKIYSSYPGTAVFCENGGIINISGYPLATSGVSSGVFGIYDYASYDFSKVFVPSGTITTTQGSTSVSGVNTLFTTELKAGATLYDPQGNIIGQVASTPTPTNTQLSLVAPSPLGITSSTFRANLNTPIAYATDNIGFVDNANGSMTLDPLSILDTQHKIKNQYNDVLVTYTYQDNTSPAFGIGYRVIRVTPNPVPNFTIASAVANPGASTFNSFCAGTQISFDASASIPLLAQPSNGGSTNSIATYAWDFGDPNSGANINSPNGPPTGQPISTPMTSIFIQSGTPGTQTYDKPVHIYNVSTVYPVNLSLTSNWGCPSLPVSVTTPATSTSNVLYKGSSGTIKVGDNPTVDFLFTGNCVGDAMVFTDKSNTPGQATSGSVAKFDWQFGDAAPGVIDYTGYNTSLTSSLPFNFPNSPDGRNNVTHLYTTPNFYQVTLTTTTDLGCHSDSTKNIAQLPWQKLPLGSAYNELFDTNGGWLPLYLNGPIPTDGRSTSTTPTSWLYDVSIGKWTIPNTYAKNEKSALYSACIDLSSIERPLIQLNSFVDLTDGEGLVLQYSKDAKNIQDKDKVWDVLGTTPTATLNPSPGLDWYSGSGLSSNPGTNPGPTYSGSNNSSGYGWSNKQVGYLKPKHKLEDIKIANSLPNDRVILRFAFASSNAGGKGVTLDSVHVGSRTRTILFENFTSTDAGTSNADVFADATAITTFVQANLNSTQLVNINYHIGFIGVDPFNMDNPADPSSRALYYNVNKVPYAFLDGTHHTGIDPITQNSSDLFKYWGQGEYDLNTLQLAKADFLDPSPSTKLTTVTSNPDGSLQVDVNFTPVFDLPFGVRGGTVLQVAVLEKQITTIPSYGKVTTGETSFGYVLKKMLPDAAGTKFSNAIKAGVPVAAGSFQWIPKNLHSDTLTVVVFLQNEDTKEVYQAFVQNYAAPAPVTAIEPITAENIKVYPNPSDQEFTIELPAPAQQNLRVTMANQLGQFTEMGTMIEGEQSKRISTQGLAEGVYILQLGSNGNALRTKVVVLHK